MNDRRSTDPMFNVIDKKLDELIGRFDDHVKWAEVHMNDDNKRLTALEQLKDNVEKPVKWIGWCVVATMAGSLAFFGEKIASVIERHLK